MHVVAFPKYWLTHVCGCMLERQSLLDKCTARHDALTSAAPKLPTTGVAWLVEPGKSIELFCEHGRIARTDV